MIRGPSLTSVVGLALGFAAVSGCRNDDPAARGDSVSGTDSSGDTDTSDATSGTPSTCSQDSDCDDGNPCRVPSCGDDQKCVFAPVMKVDCRPEIDVEYPPRAATIESGSSTVTVVGTATSPAGPIQSLTINGQDVDVSSDGSFTLDVDASVGGNILVLEVTDLVGASRRRVQSYLYSTEFVKPDAFPNGIVDEGIGLYLDQDALDDDAPGTPIDDLASLLNVALQGFDVSTFFDASTPVTSSAGYDVYLTDLNLGATTVDLLAIDGGANLSATLLDIVGDLQFDCTNALCLAAGGDSSGGLTIDGLTVSGNLLLMVNDDHEIEVMLTNVDASIDNLELYSDNGWTNFLLSIIEPFIIDGIVSDLETELEAQIDGVLGPLLADAVSGLSLSTTLEFPSLADSTMTIPIDLETDFHATDFHDGQAPPMASPPQGGAIVLRAGGYAQNVLEPYENLGVPLRDNCGAGGMVVSLPRTGILEIGLTDDVLNEILYGAWTGGILEFPYDGIQDSALVSDVEVQISGMLAPTASDCNGEGRLLTQIGDIRIEASLVLGDQPVDFVAYSTLTVELEVAADSEGIGIGFSGVDSIQTELSVMQDEAIMTEDTLIQVLENSLTDTLLTELGGGSIGGIALPVIDLSAQLGLPPGSAVIAIEVLGTDRIDGTTLINGKFGPPPPGP